MLPNKYSYPIETPTDGIYVCKSVTPIAESKLLGVELVSSSTELNAIMMPIDKEYHKFVGQRVSVEFREEFFDTLRVLYINNFTAINIVNVVEAQSTFKLDLEQGCDLDCNVVFADIEKFKQIVRAKLYCIHSTFKSSEKAVWQELRLMDKCHKIMIGRVFNYENPDANLTGKYVYCDFVMTDYGLNISLVQPCTNTPRAINPIVAVAKEYVSRIVPNLSQTAQNFIQTTDFLTFLENRIPSYDLEVGFDLVRIAVSLALAEPFKNILCSIDHVTLQEALILREAKLLLDDTALYNDDIKTVLALSRAGKLGTEKILHCITSATAPALLEHHIIDQLANTARTIVEATSNPNIL